MTTLPMSGATARLARRLDEEQGYAAGVNVGPTERMVSGLGGAVLAAYGLSRGTFGGLALAIAGGALAYRGLTGWCGAYEALGIDTAHKNRLGYPEAHKGVKVQKTFTVNRSPEECYRFWRRFENLPRFMTHLHSVTVINDRLSHWEVKGPMGTTVGWDAEILNERPNELIAWKSVGEADVDSAGSVRFRPAPGGRGTEVTVIINYEPPAGGLGTAIAKLFGEEPEQQLREDLRHFKQVMEAGEIPTAEGSPSGRA